MTETIKSSTHKIGKTVVKTQMIHSHVIYRYITTLLPYNPEPGRRNRCIVYKAVCLITHFLKEDKGEAYTRFVPFSTTPGSLCSFLARQNRSAGIIILVSSRFKGRIINVFLVSNAAVFFVNGKTFWNVPQFKLNSEYNSQQSTGPYHTQGYLFGRWVYRLVRNRNRKHVVTAT